MFYITYAKWDEGQKTFVVARAVVRANDGNDAVTILLEDDKSLKESDIFTVTNKHIIYL